MSEFKGTMGKWTATDDFTVIDDKGFSVAEADSVYRILDNYVEKTGHGHWSGHEGETYINVSGEEAQANAQLIASAPELLEALTELLGHAPSKEDLGGGSYDTSFGNAIRQAENAISKALGKETSNV